MTLMPLKKPFHVESTFATYEATAIIGEGGSGRIYEVTDDTGGKWAMKLLDHSKATSDKVKRFKNELSFCLRNKHPNVLTVVDHGILKEGSNRSPFYVMTRYDGSLRQLMDSHVSATSILDYFAQMLDGVEAAHLMKVVHRDLKPQNVLYDSKGSRVVIADFGIARFEEDDLYTAVETKDSTRLANFQYAAPEQRGRGQEVDQRADIYALGLILNEMFTGEVPLGTGYRTVGSVHPKYEYLDDLVAQMLRQSPSDRPPSIEAIKQQLIARKNEFITRQRISEVKQTVVPVTDIDDPLITDPPHLVDFDWEPGRLSLVLSQPVNEKWVWALNNMGGYTSVMGAAPGNFSFQGKRAIVAAKEADVQRIIDYFKVWLPNANRVYEQRIKREQLEDEEKHRKELEHQLQQLEARQRVLRNTKL